MPEYCVKDRDEQCSQDECGWWQDGACRRSPYFPTSADPDEEYERQREEGDLWGFRY